MTSKDPLLTRFAAEHSIDVRSLPDAERDELHWVRRCAEAVDRGYAALSEQTIVSDPAVGVLWHLLARCQEMAEGAIVTFAAASGAAAEVLSRAVVERALAIQFIIMSPRARLAAYLRHHVDDVDRQIAQWRTLASSLPDEERRVHVEACNYRAVANRTMRSLVDRLENELVGKNRREKWPSRIAERFEGLHDRVMYRTMYARLCSETHFDAEETLRYIVGKLEG
ncbi:MAG TPA: DUF5677 domain-containing protein [Vicinamibacterales bacterium]|jgi:hypothetical protein